MLFAPTAILLAFCLVNAATAALLNNRPTKKPKLAQVITQCTKRKTVALTFDDGPYIYLPEVVKALDKVGAKGTFFVNGLNWDCIYSDENIKNIRKAHSSGHMFASHTWAHLDLAIQNETTLHSEMDRVTVALERIIGVTPAFMRPPFGSYNDLVRSVAGSKGLTLAIWDFDSGDSTGASVEEIEQNYITLANEGRSNALSLAHDTLETNIQALPVALKALKKKGYNFVTVAECLGMSAYQKVGRRQNKDASWTCDAPAAPAPAPAPAL